jgi:hypothetical protein
MNSRRQVVIVVTDDFVSRLDDLTVSSHVWALRTPATEEVAQRIWDDRPPQDSSPLTSGITLFAGTGDTEGDLLSIISTVELHHGISGGLDTAVETVRVFGIGPTDTVREVFRSFGFARIDPLPDGFVARWDPS